jgi:hypothetical protein
MILGNIWTQELDPETEVFYIGPNPRLYQEDQVDSWDSSLIQMKREPLSSSANLTMNTSLCA